MSRRPAVDLLSAQRRDEERALAKLKGSALRVSQEVYAMQKLAAELPMPIQIEANNVMECLDLLRHRCHEETLRRVLGEPVTPGKLKQPLTKERPRP
jgi:hypothetical protein